MNEPLIDVIIAVYNCEAFVAEAIESAVRQSWQNIKIIVVDDGSTDGTLAVLHQLEVTYANIQIIPLPHTGVATALNTGVAASTANYIALLDADDLWHNDKLKKQMLQMERDDADMCFTYISEFDTISPGDHSHGYAARLKPIKGYFKTTMLTHRLNFVKYGGFDEKISMGDFIEWFSRLVRDNKNMVMVEEVLAYRRVHNANTTRGVNKNAYLKILKSHIDKKRGLDSLS